MTRPARALIPRESEADFETAVVNLAVLLRWRVFHPWTSIHSPAGWPDLALCKPPRLVLAELKAEGGSLSASQTAWAMDLRSCPGVEFYLWRPSDWPEIMRVLGAIKAASS